MIEKTYYLANMQGDYFLGIHRTVDGKEENPVFPGQNNILNPLSSRCLDSFNELKGYLMAAYAEFGFEMPYENGPTFFNVRFVNWGQEAEELFDRHSDGELEFFKKRITPLEQPQIEKLERIVGLHISPSR